MKEKQIWYSVSELSTTFGKSESTIKRYADKLKGIEPNAVQVRGKKIFICSDYLHLILSDQERPTGEKERPLTETISNELSEAIQREREEFQKQIEFLKGEIAEKNKQIDKLTNTVENLSKPHDSVNTIAPGITYQLSEPTEKRYWWQRLFKRK